MPNPYSRLLARLGQEGQRLDQPQYEAERQQQDMNPENLRLIDRELGRAQNPTQRGALMEERQRLEAMHAMQLQQAAQQFMPRLQQELDVTAKTGMQPQSTMQRVLMQRMMQNQQRLMNPVGSPIFNPYQPPGMGGVRG